MINLKILVPEATTNYVKNPSFELDTTGWITYGGTDAEVFEDNFQHANGALGSPWQYTNNVWTINGNLALATPVLSVQKLTDPGFEAWTSPTNLTSWGENLTGASTVNQDSAIVHGGTYSARMDVAAGAIVQIYQNLTGLGNYKWSILSVYARASIASVLARTDPLAGDSGFVAKNITLSNSAWTKIVTTWRASSTGTFSNYLTRGTASTHSIYWDDADVFTMDLSDLFATIDFGAVNANISANVSITQNTNSGVVGWLDSYTSPANFVIGYRTSDTIYLSKCVAGVYTNLIATASTHVAGEKIEMRGSLSGGTLSVGLYVNNIQIGTTQAITDAGIIGSTRHGLFSTYSGNTFSAARVEYWPTRSSLATLSRSLDRARFGRASGKIVTNGDMLNEGVFYKVSWLNGVNDVLTASIYARGGGKIRIRLADGTTGSNFISKSVNLNDTRWTRLEVTGRCSGGNDVRLWVESANPVIMSQTFYIDGAQIERKSAATSYCDGDQPGCRWNVVANATISTRTADTREGGRWVPLAGPCRPNNDLYVTTLGGFGMPPIVNNIQSWANAPGSFFQNEKIQNRVVTFSFHVKKETFRTGGSAPSILALHELRQQLINLFKSDVTLNSQAFLFEYSDSETDKKLYIRMRYEAGLEGEWDIRNRWFNSFPVRMIAVDPLWSEDNQDVMPLVIKDTYSGAIATTWARINGQWQRITETASGLADYLVLKIVQSPDGTIYISELKTSGVGTRRLSKWDGSTVTVLGTADDEILDMTFHPDGNLYVVGEFTTIGGVACNRIAKYTPSTGVFSALGTGLNGNTNSICIAPNGQIYVGGFFTSAGGVTCQKIARWDGLQWRTVGATSGFGSGLGNEVLALVNAGDGKTIYAGGSFVLDNGGSITYNRVASIDTETNLISALGYGFGDGDVYTLAVGQDGTLYAGGDFTISGAPSADSLLRVAKYNGGQTWTAMGDGLSSSSSFTARVRTLEVGINGEIFAGGIVDMSGDKMLTAISKWFGGNWLPLEFPSNGILFNIYTILQIENGDLYTGGLFLETNYEFPKLNTITNNGTASCWPILTVTGAGTLHYISNVKTGQEIFLDLTVFSGETVTIDFARGKIESDTRGDLNYTLLSGSEIRSIYLLPGENTISVLMNDDVNATMQLRWEPLDWSADAIIEADDL